MHAHVCVVCVHAHVCVVCVQAHVRNVVFCLLPPAALMGRTTAKLAMRHWSKRTCIKFESKKSHHQDFVTFVHHSIGCV